MFQKTLLFLHKKKENRNEKMAKKNTKRKKNTIKEKNQIKKKEQKKKNHAENTYFTSTSTLHNNVF